MASQFATIDDYIDTFPEDVQAILGEVRRTIRKAIPDVGETISYQMPTMTLDGTNLVHFAAWKHHLGMYPLPEGDDAFEEEIAPYKSAKATVRFPFSKPIPYALVERLALLLAEQRAYSG